MARFKLDENADPRWRVALESAGNTVFTVTEEGLCGAEDHRLAEACRREGLCLVTCDKDFTQVLDYPPADYAGIVVLRHPRPTTQGLAHLIEQIVVALRRESLEGKLWIVEPGRIRIHGEGPPGAL